MLMNIDLGAMWHTFKFLLVHMFRYELLVALTIAGLSAWRLAAVLTKHNARAREAVFSKRLGTGCFVCVLVLFLTRQFLL